MRTIIKFIVRPIVVALIYSLAAWFCVRQLALAHLAIESMRLGIIRPQTKQQQSAPQQQQPRKR